LRADRSSLPEERLEGGRQLGLKRVFAAAVVTAAAAVGLAGAAGAVPIGRCTPHLGTIVAVDFAHWGGPIVRGCGLRQRTDYDLLHAAGFTTAGDQHDGPAFMCRLGNAAFHHGRQYPAPAQDDCVLTPSAAAYWSYWLAPAGQNHWSYSQLGAMSAVPKPGEVELWTFGATNIAGTRGSGVPAFSPATLRAHNPPPAPSTTATHTTSAFPTTTTPASTPHTTTASATQTTTAAPATTTASAPRRHHRDVARARAAPAAATHHRRPGPGSPSSTSTTTTSTTSARRLVDAQATKPPTSSSSAAPVVIGLGLALLLCAGAGWTIWQRRRYE
jgi:hypothetical protein